MIITEKAHWGKRKKEKLTGSGIREKRSKGRGADQGPCRGCENLKKKEKLKRGGKKD